MTTVDFSLLLSNHLLWAALWSWATAQVVKTIIHAIVNKKIDWHRLLGDGGMPSGHSATVTSLATSAAITYGLDSPIFAVTAILAIVVMHDAMGVRLEAGKHAKMLNDISRMLERMTDEKITVDVKLKEFLGHTPLQVFFGAVTGFIVAVILG